MNIALIFAGGSGVRMNSRTKPKQFLALHGKEIIVYTLEIFQEHPEIDKILLVCVDDWVEYMETLIIKYNLTKVMDIIPGGSSTQDSQYKGIDYLVNHHTPEDAVVLIHDGVRPLVDMDTISRNIASVKKYGSAVTVTPAIETIVYVNDDDEMNQIVDRKKCRMAKAPQSYRFGDIYAVHLKALNEGKTDFIDSACMMQYYGREVHTVEGNTENIKITTPIDFYLFRAIVDARENSQIWGI